MDGSVTSLRDIVIILITGAIAGFIALKFKLPTIIGYILAGVSLSIVLPLINITSGLSSSLVSQIASFGIALLLFAAGIEFSVNNILKIRNLIIVGVLSQTAIIIFLGVLIMPLFGLSSYESLFVGVVAATSSTAFVLKMLEQNEEISSTSSKIMIGWLIVQDILGIALFLFLKSLAPGQDFNIINLIDPIFKSLILIVVTFTIGKVFVPPIFKEIAKTRSQELLLVSVLGLSIGFALFSELIGVSYTLGAFLTGLALSGTFLRHEIFTEIKPLRDLFSMVFFVSIGSLLNISSIFNNLLVIAAIIGILISFKIGIIFIINILFKIHPKNAAKVALGISQIGEFAFLVITIARHNDWINTNFYSIILVATVISMTITPFLYSKHHQLFKLTDNFFKNYLPNFHRKYYKSRFQENEKPELLNHIIIVGHGKVGRYVAKALNISNEDHIIIEIDSNLIDLISKDNHKVILGDATNIEILKEAQVQSAKALIITLPDTNHEQVSNLIKIVKDLNNNIEIIIRSSRVILDDENISTIVEPEFEAAIRIINRMDGMISQNKYGLIKKVRNFRRKEIKEILNKN